MLMLSGCGGGVMKAALINAGTNVANSIVIDDRERYERLWKG